MELFQVIFLAVFFFEILPKFIDFVNSDGCIGKITSKSIRLYKVTIKKKEYFPTMGSPSPPPSPFPYVHES